MTPTLEERVSMLRGELMRIGPQWGEAFPDEAAEQLARAFAPELFANPPTHWLAPWEATKEMADAMYDVEEAGETDPKTLWEPITYLDLFAAARDAHLKTETGG